MSNPINRRLEKLEASARRMRSSAEEEPFIPKDVVDMLDRYAAIISHNREVDDELAYLLQEQGMDCRDALVEAKRNVVRAHPDGGPELLEKIDERIYPPELRDKSSSERQEWLERLMDEKRRGRGRMRGDGRK
jgi:hypothetical protein